MLVMFFGVMIIEPNGVPSTTCPGCDIWLLMENHISMSTFHKNILQVILFDFVIEWFQIFTDGFEEGIPNIPITKHALSCLPFSPFCFPPVLMTGEKRGKRPLAFVFKEHIVFYVKKCSLSERWDKNDQWKTNKCPIQCLWVIFYVKSCFWEEEMWVKRRSIFEVFEGKPFFWIWRMNVARGWWEKTDIGFWKNGWDFRKAGIIQKVRVFVFNLENGLPY